MEFLIKNKCYIKQQDNLEMMEDLKSESIDLIYCDILYNTGKKFKDYEDKLGTPQEAIEWYKPRLIEMKRLLKSTGSIYLQCDYRLVHYLKVLMDEVFGIEKLINEIIWEYPKSIKNSQLKELNNHDTILHYSKDKNYTHINQVVPYTQKQLERFKYSDINGKYYLDTRRDSNGDKKRVKVYLKKKGTPCGDVWYFNFEQGKNKLDYFSQKPKSLLERVIKASSNKGDVVADFFMGSGTTGEVALELDRKFIGCDIGEKAFNITKERLQRFDIK